MTEKQPLSDAELKAQILAKNAHENPGTQFPTEIVPLPSQGLVYPAGSPLSVGQVEIRYMTAKDEDILTNQNLIKSGKALDKLYESLVVGNGEGKPINLNDMIVGDRSAIMLASRILGYGPDYEIEVMNPTTNKTFKHTVNLHDLKPKVIVPSIYKNSRLLDFKLPISKKLIQFNLQTNVEAKAIAGELKRQEKHGISKPITTVLKHVIVPIDGDDDKKVINDFVDNQLLAKDSLDLRSYMTDVAPDFDLTVRVSDPDVGFHDDIVLPIDTSFFWPRS